MAPNLPSNSASAPKVVQDCHDLLLWLIPHLDKYPRIRRYTLGERLESGLLDVLGLLVEAAYSRNSRSTLALANRRLEIVRHLWRLSHELNVIPTKRYVHGSDRIDQLGRQIGGWLKSRREPIKA